MGKTNGRSSPDVAAKSCERKGGAFLAETGERDKREGFRRATARPGTIWLAGGEGRKQGGRLLRMVCTACCLSPRRQGIALLAVGVLFAYAGHVVAVEEHDRIAAASRKQAVIEVFETCTSHFVHPMSREVHDQALAECELQAHRACRRGLAEGDKGVSASCILSDADLDRVRRDKRAHNEGAMIGGCEENSRAVNAVLEQRARSWWLVDDGGVWASVEDLEGCESLPPPGMPQSILLYPISMSRCEYDFVIVCSSLGVYTGH